MLELVLGLGLGVIGTLQVVTILVIIFHLGRKIGDLGPTIVGGVVAAIGPEQLEDAVARHRQMGFQANDKEREAIHWKNRKRLDARIDRIYEFLAQTEKESNPIPSEEITKFKNYLDRVKRGELLSSTESKEFIDLGNKIRDRLPEERRKIWDYLLTGFFGFVIGLLVGYLITKK